MVSKGISCRNFPHAHLQCVIAARSQPPFAEVINELKKLKDFKSFEEVRDCGQYRISSTFICWYKGEEVRARLVARGFEEVEKVPGDSPTVEKCNVRLIFAICAGMKWIIATLDVKSAFLQGRKLEREVVIKPPREANAGKDVLWKLLVPLYGLSDRFLQFFYK